MTLHFHDWMLLAWAVVSLVGGVLLGRAMAASPVRESEDDDAAE
jgi:hypothetical protein